MLRDAVNFDLSLEWKIGEDVHCSDVKVSRNYLLVSHALWNAAFRGRTCCRVALKMVNTRLLSKTADGMVELTRQEEDRTDMDTNTSAVEGSAGSPSCWQGQRR